MYHISSLALVFWGWGTPRIWPLRLFSLTLCYLISLQCSDRYDWATNRLKLFKNSWSIKRKFKHYFHVSLSKFYSFALSIQHHLTLSHLKFCSFHSWSYYELAIFSYVFVKLLFSELMRRINSPYELLREIPIITGNSTSNFSIQERERDWYGRTYCTSLRDPDNSTETMPRDCRAASPPQTSHKWELFIDFCKLHWIDVISFLLARSKSFSIEMLFEVGIEFYEGAIQ